MVSQELHAQEAEAHRFALPPEAISALAPLAQQQR